MHPILEPIVNYRFISCFFSFVCFLLLLIANCSHSWKTYHMPKGEFSLGLWILCFEKHGCMKLKYINADMEITQTLMILAAVATIIATICVIEWNPLIPCNFSFLPKVLMTSIFNFLAGILVLIALVMFDFESRKIAEKRTAFKDWAFYLSGFTGALCLMKGTLDLMAYKFSLWGSRPTHCHVGPEQKDAVESPAGAPALL